MKLFSQCISLSILFPLLVNAQVPSETTGPIEAQTYGTTSVSYLTLPTAAFQPSESDVTYDFTGSPYSIYRTGGGNFFHAPVNLPSGAQVVQMELHACDSNSSAEISTLFQRQPHVAIAGHVTVADGPETGLTPGCGFFSVTLPSPYTIDNPNNSYHVLLSITGTDGTVRFAGFRIGYKLQVSPAPSTATFPNDVPTTHPFFRFVEALAAAGITSGCAPGSFCPDAPVTRGQMAVFLSAALGLHWAP